jgi:hypothetical protein
MSTLKRKHWFQSREEEEDEEESRTRKEASALQAG